MLTACTIFYNDAELLEQMFLSLKKLNIPSIAIDGAFNKFPHEKIHSTDGSIDVAKKYADKFIEADHSFLKDQCTKRTRYIKEIPDGEYFLVIDSDEQLIGGKPAISKLKRETYSLGFEEMDRNQISSTIRVHKKHPDLIYYLRHCYLYHEKQMDKEAIKELYEFFKKEKYVDSKMAIKALKGCKTQKKEPYYLVDDKGLPLVIKHYQDRRINERQMEDNIYLGNREGVDELTLSQYLPDGLIKDELGPEEKVKFVYQGKTHMATCDFGKVYPGMIYETTYEILRKFQTDYSPYHFFLIKD